MNVVIDTNVFISSALSPNGKPARIVDYIEHDVNFIVYYNADILDEYNRVLSYKKLNIAEKKKTRIINIINKFGIKIEAITSNILLPDESDRIFYDTAKAANAYLITGNLKYYPEEPHILTPTQFVEMFEK